MVTIQPRRPNATTAERLALCDYLDGLDEAAWSAQSWCEAWTAHQVVAHLSTSTTTGLWDMIRGASRARGDFDRMEREQAVHLAADVAASELIAQIRATASSMKRTPMSSPLDPLTDIIVHGQDTAGYPTANWCYRRGGSKPTIPWPTRMPLRRLPPSRSMRRCGPATPSC